MYGIEDKLIAIVASLGLLLQAVLLRKYVGSYLAPAAFFPLVWFVYTIVPLTLLFDVPINCLSVVFILLCSLVFSLSALTFDWRFARRKCKVRSASFDPGFDRAFLRWLLFLSAALAMLFSTLTMLANGWSIGEVFFDLLATSGRFAALRGNEGVEYGVYGTLSIFFTYLAPVLGGAIATSQNSTSRKVLYSTVALLPGVFTMIIQSSKLILFVALSFYFGAVFLAKILNNSLGLMRKVYVLRIVIAVLVVFPLLLISFASRNGYAGISDLSGDTSVLKYALSSYFLGQIYAFSDFFSAYVGMPAATIYKDAFGSYGVYTFASVFDALGFPQNFPPGLYEETASYRDIFETNIFTAFRGLIYDFGAAGTLIFMFLFGWLSNSIFYRVLTGGRPWLSSCVYVVLIVFFLMSYLNSIFLARYAFLNALAVYLIFRINGEGGSARPHIRSNSVMECES